MRVWDQSHGSPALLIKSGRAACFWGWPWPDNTHIQQQRNTNTLAHRVTEDRQWASCGLVMCSQRAYMWTDFTFFCSAATAGECTTDGCCTAVFFLNPFLLFSLPCQQSLTDSLLCLCFVQSCEVGVLSLSLSKQLRLKMKYNPDRSPACQRQLFIQ